MLSSINNHDELLVMLSVFIQIPCDMCANCIWLVRAFPTVMLQEGTAEDEDEDT